MKIAICNPFRVQSLWIPIENVADIALYSRPNIVEFNCVRSASGKPFVPFQGRAQNRKLEGGRLWAKIATIKENLAYPQVLVGP